MATSHRKAPARHGQAWARAAVAVSGIAAATIGAAPSAVAVPVSTPISSPLDIVRGLLPTGNTVITPDNAAKHGFKENDTRAPGKVEYTKDYGDPRGKRHGALGLTTPDSSSKAGYFTDEKNGSLARFATSAAYSTYRDSSSTGSDLQYPSYQIAIDANGGTLADGGFSTLTYEPVYNVTDPGTELKDDTWQRWNVAKGKVCSTRQIGGFEANQTRCDNGGLRSIADVVTANPDAIVLGFGLNQGSGNPGITAAADLLTGAGTTYDFEVTKPKFPLPLPFPPKGDRCDDEHHGSWGNGQWGKDEHHDRWGKKEHHDTWGEKKHHDTWGEHDDWWKDDQRC